MDYPNWLAVEHELSSFPIPVPNDSGCSAYLTNGIGYIGIESPHVPYAPHPTYVDWVIPHALGVCRIERVERYEVKQSLILL